MRPIEFRAWDKKAKVIIYPVVVYETQDHVGFSEETFRRCYDQNGWYEHLEVGGDWYYLFDDKIMQFTGLLDANGQKIFEGDILKGDYNKTYDFAWWKVVYRNDYCGFYTSCIALHDKKNGFKDISKGGYQNIGISSSLTIIGNIYQNKELLNEVKNDSAN